MKNKPIIKKIIIVNCFGGDGGCIALSLLCKLLAQRGYDARLMIFPYFQTLNNTSFVIFWRDWLRFHLYNFIKKKINNIFCFFCLELRLETWDFSYKVGRDCKQQFNPFFSRNNTIVVYPEIVHGNYLKARNVVRWLLYHYKYAEDIRAYNKDDTFICYREVFNDWNLNPRGTETPLIFFNTETFHQYNFSRRKKCCYLLRKGRERSDLPQVFDGPVIDYGMTDVEICQLFNEHKYCYFYDTQTFYTTYAIVCGCIPIVVPEPGKSRKDYLKGNDGNGYGVAYGDTKEELEFAINTRNEVFTELANINRKNERSIDNFLEILQEKYVLIKHGNN